MAVLFPNGVVKFAGLVVDSRYESGYHDDYLYVTLFDGEKESVETVWTTAGVCEDGCPEVEIDGPREAWLAKREAEADAAFAADHPRLAAGGVSRAQFEDLCRAYGTVEAWRRNKVLRAIESLLTTKEFKSEFRRSLAEQVRGWIENPAARRHGTPLSERQLRCVVR